MTPSRRALARELIGWLDQFRERHPRHDVREYLAAWVAGLDPDQAVSLSEAQLRELVVALYADATVAPPRRRRWSRWGEELLTSVEAAALDRSIETER